MENFVFDKPSFLIHKSDIKNEVAITKTEAEFIADQIAELNKATLFGDLENQMKFYTELISVMDKDGKGQQVKKGIDGTTEEQLDKVIDELNKNCELTSLEAYLREAICYLSQMDDRINKFGIGDYKVLKGYNDDLTLNSDYLLINNKNIDRNSDILYKEDLGFLADYFKSQTYASYYGSRVLHRNGALSISRKDLNDKLRTGSKVAEVGSSLLITEYSPTISADKLEEKFFKLQGIQRDHQARYNSLKTKLDKKYNTLMKEKNQKLSDLISESNRRSREIDAEFKIWKQEQESILEGFKIIIPTDFISIYNGVKSKLS